MPGNTALLIPNNFLRSEKPTPTTTTEEPYQTPLTTKSIQQSEQTSKSINDSHDGTTSAPATTIKDETIPTKNSTEVQISEDDQIFSVLPGPEFDNKWIVPIKMHNFMFMRRFMSKSIFWC